MCVCIVVVVVVVFAATATQNKTAYEIDFNESKFVNICHPFKCNAITLLGMAIITQVFSTVFSLFRRKIMETKDNEGQKSNGENRQERGIQS